MINLSTKTKYFLVKIVNNIVCFPLKLKGGNIKSKIVQRRSLNWSLDLNEVIDFLIYISGSFDKQGVKKLSNKIIPEDIVIDIGANVGSMSLNIAKLLNEKGAIISIEPSDYAYKRLENNFRINSFKCKHILIQGFMTNILNEKPNHVYASWNMNSDQIKHKDHMGILTSTKEAKSYTLDSIVNELNLARVDWVKMDVDGYEELVLDGSHNVLQSFKPHFFMELSEYPLLEQNSSVENVLSILIKYDYHFYSLNNVYLGQDIEAIKKTIPKMGATNIFAYAKD